MPNKLSKSRMRGGSSKRSKKSSGKNVSFAAKLGAFMLESVNKKVEFSMNGGFSGTQEQVSGVLPYLHINIKESSFLKTLTDSKMERKDTLKNICNGKNLEKTLVKVNFDCERQSMSGITSVDKGLLDSINNRWSIRKNGQKRLREILGYQKKQVKEGIIPAASVEWGKGL
uniref:Uncharacterized protein n=1 Tax=Mimiviridae sp. ChoanoV1 TaxID=2596887 RepID=A0A5B8HYP6_9VIRU|nr:hypothetical protein 8_37 [Mimiviridae sp. ChoanoV1]